MATTTTTTTTTATTATTTVGDKFAAGLGALVWWDFDNSFTTPDALRANLSRHGYDPAVVPDINVPSAFRTATRHWTLGRGNADRYRGAVSKVDGDMMTASILMQQRYDAGDTKKDVAWLPAAHVALDTVTGQLTVIDGDTAHKEAVDSFVKFAARAITHLDHNFIRPVIVQAELSKCKAFSLRRSGGVMFVPSEFVPAVEQLAGMVAEIGNSSIEIEVVTQTSGAYAKSARTALASELADLHAKMEGWMDGSRSARPTSIAAALEEFSELQSRANLYADTLQMKVDDILADLEQAKSEARELLADRQEAIDGKRAIAPATLEKLAKAVELGRNDDGSVVITVANTAEAGLGRNVALSQWRWLPGGMYADAMATMGLQVTDVTSGRVRLEALAA